MRFAIGKNRIRGIVSKGILHLTMNRLQSSAILALVLLSTSSLPFMANLAPRVRAQDWDDNINLYKACVDGMAVGFLFVPQPPGYMPGSTFVVSWGDGHALNENYNHWSSSVGHIYATAGTYVITVTASFFDGTSASAIQAVTVPTSTPTSCVPLTITAGKGGHVTYQARGNTLNGSAHLGASVTLEVAAFDSPYLAAFPDQGFAFSGWTASGGIEGETVCEGQNPSRSLCPSLGTRINATSANLELAVYDTASVEADFVPATTTSVVCSPSTVVFGSTAACTATVKGDSPTGVVTWASGSAGAFSPPSCVLSLGVCSASYTPQLTASSVTITAAYEGDQSNAGSLGASDLTVNPVLTAGAITSLDPTVGVGESIQLNANPSGGAPPYIFVWYVAGGPGNCSTLDVQVSTGPAYSPSPKASTYYCYVATDSETPPVSANSSAELVTVSTLPVSTLTPSCSQASVAVGTTITCSATVKGKSSSAPTGNVAWSSSGPGTFSSGSCTLSRRGFHITCSVKFTPTAAGSSLSLTASYLGDSKNAPSAGAYRLTATMKATKTTVSCTPQSTVAGSPATITCTVNVTGYLPTGLVSWSQTGRGSVSFSDTSCTLSQGTCSVSMKGSAAGTVKLLATYGGDTNDKGSSGMAKLVVRA